MDKQEKKTEAKRSSPQAKEDAKANPKVVNDLLKRKLGI